MLLLFTTPLLEAKSDFAGGLVGGMAGSMLGTAITQPRRTHTTTVVTKGGEVTYADLEALKSAVRSDLLRINDMVNDNSRIVQEVRSNVRDLQYQLEGVEKRVSELEQGSLSKREKDQLENLNSELNDLKSRVEEIHKKITVE